MKTHGPLVRRLLGCLASLLLLMTGGVVLALPASAAPVQLMAFARGDQVVPGPGDPDGFAVGQFQVDAETDELCYTVGAVGLTLPATAMHLSEGPAGVEGDVVATLDASIVNDTFADDVCETIDPAVADGIAADPGRFSLNIATSDFPAGAVRGQLETPPQPAYLEATGDGTEVVPGPGDPDGTVEALFAVYADDGMVCALIDAVGVTVPADALDIHEGVTGEVGPTVVPLDPVTVDSDEAYCVDADPAVLSAMVANPADHYVDIHTSDFADGAVRAQLAAGQPFEPIPTPSEGPATTTTTAALPRSVPAGSGGQAAEEGDGRTVGAWVVAAGGVFAGVSAMGWRRRRAQTGSA